MASSFRPNGDNPGAMNTRNPNGTSMQRGRKVTAQPTTMRQTSTGSRGRVVPLSQLDSRRTPRF